MVHCKLVDAMYHSGGVRSDSTVTRTRRATGEALLVPLRNWRSKVGRITGDPGKSTEDERVAEGLAVPTKPGNAGGGKRPCCL